MHTNFSSQKLIFSYSRKSGLFLSMRSKGKIPPSTVLEGSKDNTLAKKPSIVLVDEETPTPTKKKPESLVSEIQQNVLLSKPVKPLVYYKKYIKKIEKQTQVSQTQSNVSLKF